MGSTDGRVRSNKPGNFARFTRLFKLEEKVSTLRDADENGADRFADLAQDIRLISGGIHEVTQVELRAKMNAQFLFVRPQLKLVLVPARFDWSGAIFWPGILKSLGRLDLDNSVLPAKDSLQIAGQDRVRKRECKRFDAVQGNGDPVGRFTRPALIESYFQACKKIKN